MSGLGGVWDLGGAGDLRRGLEMLGRHLVHRGTGEPCHRVEGAAAVVFRPFEAAADPSEATQPARLAGGGCLTWDGRLDNAAELAGRLWADARWPETVLLGRAYRRWGRDLPRHLLGDFALAVWDPRGPRVLLARDPMGVRPLFYCWEQGVRAIWGSTLESVLAATGASGEVDEEWIAGFLTVHTDLGRTPYRGISAVPPGHVAVIEPDGVRSLEYWRPEALGPLRYRDDREYEEHFSALFHEAVRRRMAGEHPVGVELSGGLDSSSIACAAGALVEEGRTRAPAVCTVSYVYRESTTADERRYIRRVEEALGRPGHHVIQEDHPIFDRLDESFYEMPNVLDCTKARWAELVRYLRSEGARVLLTGVGGDELLWSEVESPVHLSDLLVQGRFRDLGRELRQWAPLDGRPYLSLVAYGVLAPLVPSLRRRVDHRGLKLSRWIDRDFAQRLRLSERLAALRPGAGDRGRLPSQREHVSFLRGSARLVAWRYDAGPVPLDVAYPYLDRQLVEFCLSLPFDQLVRGEETRSILRRALRDRLPRAIRERRSKTTMDEAVLRACGEQWSSIRRIFPEPLVCREGFADPEGVRRVLDEARFGQHQPGHGITRLLALEYWLRNRARSSTDRRASEQRPPERSIPATMEEERR